MSNEKIHIDDLLAGTYKGFEPAVPALMWDKIAHELDRSDNRKGFAWWKVAVVVAIVAGIASIALRYLNHRNNDELAGAPAKSSTKAQSPLTDKNSQSGQPNENGTRNMSSANPENQILNGSTGTGVEVESSRSIHHIQIPRTPNAASQGNKMVETPGPREISKNTYGSNLTDILTPFGIRYFETDVNESNAETDEASGTKITQLKNDIGPANVKPGSPVYISIGVGQIMSSTSFNINPSLSNYVHKNFTTHMQQGEGILATLSFSGNVAYRIAKSHHFAYIGLSYFQRKNSLNFNFTDDAPAFDAVNSQKDIFGNYPIKSYVHFGSGISVKYTGTNTITAYEIPVGWMGQFRLGRKFTFIPTAGFGLGFLNINSNNVTLNYQKLDAEKVNRDWYRKTYYNVNSSLGVYRNFGEFIKLGINATAGYNLSQMYIPNSPVRPRAFTGGLSTQLVWRLTN